MVLEQLQRTIYSLYLQCLFQEDNWGRFRQKTSMTEHSKALRSKPQTVQLGCLSDDHLVVANRPGREYKRERVFFLIRFFVLFLSGLQFLLSGLHYSYQSLHSLNFVVQPELTKLISLVEQGLQDWSCTQ